MPTRSRILAATAVAALTSTLCSAVTAHAVVSKPPVVHDVPGTKLVKTTIRTHDGRSDAWLFKVDLSNRDLVLQPALDRDVLNASHESVPSMAHRTRAIAGINGDFWNWDRFDTAGPSHGLTIHGHVYKTPGVDRAANFYTTTDGRAHIGVVTNQLAFTYRTARNVTMRTPVFSLNNYDDILRRHIVLVTHDLSAVRLPYCSVAYLSRSKTAWLVTRVLNRQTSLSRQTVDREALVRCGRYRVPLTVGQKLKWAPTVSVPNIVSLISGGSQIIRKGVAYRDPKPQYPTNSLNPMTFACIARTGYQVTLGVVDGRRRDSVGIRPAQLTKYLLTLGCWNAMTFDGGGSSTMYARHAVQNVPADGSPRKVADGLFVYRR